MNSNYQPVILIGAARSGTKLVRDLVAVQPFVDKVPYDVNYIWRIGNENAPDDELSKDSLSSGARRIILREIERFWKGAPCLIEKTVSNCLRVSFVHDLFPNAKFIHLIRDGRDVVESAYRQWRAPADWRYIVKKATTYPLLKSFDYALHYAYVAVRKTLVGKRDRVGVWGPRYKGIEADLKEKGLLEVCALQWVRSVEKAREDFKDFRSDRLITIRYEDFVQRPREHLESIAGFLEMDAERFRKRMDMETVQRGNIGKGLRRMSRDEASLVEETIKDTQKNLGYQ